MYRMYQNYAQAAIALLENGTSIEVVLQGLQKVLKEHAHEKLYPRVLAEIVRIFEVTERVQGVSVSVAKDTDSEALKTAIKKALAVLEVPENAPVMYHTNPALIGGFVASYNHHEVDSSYKRALTSLYAAITNN